MEVTVFSHAFPTKTWPSQGIVIKNELDILHANGIGIQLVVPQVIAPMSSQQERTNTLVSSKYPKHIVHYFSVPKRKFPQLTLNLLSFSLVFNKKLNFTKLVHLHWLYPNGILAPFFKKRGHRVVLTIHGSDWHTNFQKPFMKTLIKNALINADRIITVGKDLGDTIGEFYPEVSTKIKSVSHGINCDLFKPKMIIKSVNKQNVNILCVANFFEVKGVTILLNALKNLKESNFNLTIISSAADLKYKNACEEIINNSNLKDCTIIIEKISQEDLVHYYQEADFFVLPSLKEAFGLALAEAQACGLPSISTKSGGPEEIITEETGVLVEPGNVFELENAIIQMIKDYKSYNSEIIRNHIVTNFSEKAKFQQIESIYKSLID